MTTDRGEGMRAVDLNGWAMCLGQHPTGKIPQRKDLQQKLLIYQRLLKTD